MTYRRAPREKRLPKTAVSQAMLVRVRWGFVAGGVFVAATGCALPPVVGATVVGPRFAPPGRIVRRYNLGACEGPTGAAVPFQPLSARLVAVADGYSLVLDRPEQNSLHLDRSAEVSAVAVVFQLVLRPSAEEPQLWDIRLPIPPDPGTGLVRTIANWDERGSALEFELVRSCRLEPEAPPAVQYLGQLPARVTTGPRG